MSQLEKEVESFLLVNPALRQAYSVGLINRRALARRIIEQEKGLSKNNFEAIIAVLRRLKFEKSDENSNKTFCSFRIIVKDGIAIANLEKSKQLLKNLEKLMQKISYEKNETFKLVVGSSSIKVFLDEKNLSLIDSIASKSEIIYTHKKISEFSLHFEDCAASTKGILSFISSSLAISEIPIEEFLTCSPELLIYVNGENTLKAYDCLKGLQN